MLNPILSVHRISQKVSDSVRFGIHHVPKYTHCVVDIWHVYNGASADKTDVVMSTCHQRYDVAMCNEADVAHVRCIRSSDTAAH